MVVDLVRGHTTVEVNKDDVVVKKIVIKVDNFSKQGL